ncbi:hypothetical protein SEA_ESTES_49 [Mycobacterium phage Estes]|uniref:Uncharacterized protein n=1 Tax=Mycobacterium phage Estes TaxID=2759459 RepID=A0A7G9A2B9_9CAUD|nr:hypothetical protein J4U03_gp049 [Mycobacterium phage Estes]QNL30758.1 hypothetical protein SEA_ESTES_49 [Mycobacterium phage Estes]
MSPTLAKQLATAQAEVARIERLMASDNYPVGTVVVPDLHADQVVIRKVRMVHDMYSFPSVPTSSYPVWVVQWLDFSCKSFPSLAAAMDSEFRGLDFTVIHEPSLEIPF